MNVRDLIPWGRGSSTTPSVYRDLEQNPFLTLHREVNRLFDDMFRGFDVPGPSLGRLSSWNATWPSVEVSETDKELRIVAEVPGLDEKDVEVLLADGAVTLRGEKRSETEDKDRQFSERFYGRFERRIPFGSEIEEDKVTAAFNNGVLTVTLPKSEKAQAKTKRIAISSKQ
jgi:HSP20 family protein